MSENFVRKTLKVEDITKKETYTLNDLDLVQTKDGRVFIRTFKKKANTTNDPNAYLMEIVDKALVDALTTKVSDLTTKLTALTDRVTALEGQ